jgi:hypothetical protein
VSGRDPKPAKLPARGRARDDSPKLPAVGRKLIDPNGITWLVVERAADGSYAELAAGSLRRLVRPERIARWEVL